MKIKRLEKFKALQFLKTELKKVKDSPEQVSKRIAIFYEEYNRQHALIPDRLKMALKLDHQEQYKRIEQYKNDIEELKKKIDRFVLDFQDEDRKKTLGEKLKHSKFGTFTLIFRDMNRMNNEYRKENNDIDNFEV